MDNSTGMKSLAEKIAALPQWFDSLKEAKVSIHDVIEFNGETWVIWSDTKGYSVSHWGFSHGCKSQGVSGAYSNIVRCINYIYGILDLTGGINKIIDELERE